QVLYQLGFGLERDDRAEVFARAQHLAEEALAGGLFIGQRVGLAARYIDQHGDGDWQVGLPLEGKDLLRLIVFQDFDVVFLEIVDVAIRLVGDVERHGDQLRADLDGRIILRVFVGRFFRVFLLRLAGLRFGVLREAERRDDERG